MASNTPVFRIIYYNQDDVYEIYACSLSESNMFGFLEVGELLFNTRSSMVIDPAEERLKTEFSDVKRFYIPTHNIIRIDEVAQEGTAKVKPAGAVKATISTLPHAKLPGKDG
jgi:hypothetical protein